MNTQSRFLLDLHYFFAQTDGTYAIPNSSVGDLLKRAKIEIEALLQPPSTKNYINHSVVELQNMILSNTISDTDKRQILAELNFRTFNTGYRFGKTDAELSELSARDFENKY